jgi:hypothetical protein
MILEPSLAGAGNEYICQSLEVRRKLSDEWLKGLQKQHLKGR